MKRLTALFLLCASLGLAEDATLSNNTVMRTDNSLVILKAGTVVHVLVHNDKTISVKVGDKVGLIPWTALEESEESMLTAPTARPRPNSPAPASTSATTTATTAPAPTPPPPRPAQTMYGKAVEKARENAASHEKNLVDPADEVLGGK